MEFIEVNILGDKKKFSKKYKCPVQLGLYSNSNAYDKDRCLQALAVSFLLIVIARHCPLHFIPSNQIVVCPCTALP